MLAGGKHRKAGCRDSKQAGEQGHKAGEGEWNGHKGFGLMGKMGPRRLGSRIGCSSVFWLRTCQVGINDN